MTAAQENAPEALEVRVPLLDTRNQVEAVLVVRGPWAELLGAGATITITAPSEPA